MRLNAEKYEITSGEGLSAVFTNAGASLMSLKLADSPSLVLGLNGPADYLINPLFCGCLVGRYANRIAGGRFEIDGVEFRLGKNEGDTTLHGGPGGLGRCLWRVLEHTATSVTFTIESPDGDEGFPGNLSVHATYSLHLGGELRLLCTATTDAPTFVSLTNHAYFNLSGDAHSPITDHELILEADAYTPVDGDLIPVGRMAKLENSPLALRERRPLSAVLSAIPDGIDHNYAIVGDAGQVRAAAWLFHAATGRGLTIASNQAGLQVYTGGALGGPGSPFPKYAGLCLEPQEFPDGPNQAAFPAKPLRPGEIYRHETIYRFTQS